MKTPSQKSSEPSEKSAKTPQRRRGRERVAALIRAGATVFAEVGYEAATMTEIAARAGASIGSLYQFFPTKEHLAAEIHARQLDALAAMLDELSAEASGAAPRSVADLLFERLVAFFEANPAFMVLAERRSIDPGAKKRARTELRGQIVALLAALAPPVPAKRRAALAALILHLIRVAAMLRADDDRAIRGPAFDEMRAMLGSCLADAAGPACR